ncbi:MAG TPA: extracellular solute-binding protein [Thiotrichales bacterium]|nr:extracellular solute-binding protein [Thiotrichales bacterium]
MKPWLSILALAIALVASVFLWQKAHQPAGQTVVVYVSEDQVFSEPILEDFERETGIRVQAVYDTEEAKSTGAMNRLIAEKDNPQADVYWANEPIRAEVLKQKGISAAYVSPNAADIPPIFRDPEGYWTGFSARARVFIVHDSVKSPPQGVRDYTDPRWKGRAVIANPLFGTTTSEIAALFTVWGDDQGRAFLEGLRRNEVTISSSNGESADFVAAGRYAFSLVDSDDAVNRMRQGKPVSMVYPDQAPGGLGTFIVPNAAVLIRGAPHPDAARRLMDYLLSPETERKLARADCAQIPLHPGVAGPPELKPMDQIRVMQVRYADVAQKLVEIQPLLRRWLGL